MKKWEPAPRVSSGLEVHEPGNPGSPRGDGETASSARRCRACIWIRRTFDGCWSGRVFGRAGRDCGITDQEDGPAATHRRPGAALLVRLLLAWAVLAPATASPLAAQSCLGFSGDGFVGASGSTRREWSYTTTGFGGSAGLKIGRLAAVGSYLKFSGTDQFDQEFGFQNLRAAVAYEAVTSSLSLCPVLTLGSEGVSSRGSSSIPYRAAPFFGGGLALGRRFIVEDSGIALIPSLIVTTESHSVERIIEGDIATRSREANALLRGGVTVEFGRLFVRPFVALMAVDNGWLTGEYGSALDSETSAQTHSEAGATQSAGWPWLIFAACMSGGRFPVVAPHIGSGATRPK